MHGITVAEKVTEAGTYGVGQGEVVVSKAVRCLLKLSFASHENLFLVVLPSLLHHQ